MLISPQSNTPNLRIALQEKAKSIRENAFVLKKYSSSRPQGQRIKTQERHADFASMFNRITLEAKREIEKKKSKSRVNSFQFFNNTFVIQKIKTNEKTKTVKQDNNILTYRLKMPENVNNRSSFFQLRMKSLQKNKARKICKGNSLSRYPQSKPSQKKKVSTEQSVLPNDSTEMFQPIGMVKRTFPQNQDKEIAEEVVEEEVQPSNRNFQSSNSKKRPIHEGYDDDGQIYRTIINQRKTFAYNFRGKGEKKKKQMDKNLLSPW